MGRISASSARDLYSAYASVYEGYGKKKKGDCVSKSEKGEHNCAKKVCHEQYGEGECIFGQHAVPDENGFVSHYDVQFEHGVVENVSVEELEIITEGSHNEENHRYDGEQLAEQSRPTGQQRAALRTARRQAAADLKATEVAAGGGQAGIDNALKQRYGGRMPSERQLARHSSGASAARSVAATGRENLYRGGGGDAAMKEKGQTRDQVMAQGVKNFKAQQATPTPTPTPTPKPTPAPAASPAPATPTGSAVADKTPAPAAKPVPTGTTAGGTKFQRRLPTMAELRAAQAARKAGKGEEGAVRAAVNVGKSKTSSSTSSPASTQDKRQKKQTSRLDNALSGIKPGAGVPKEDVDLFDLVKGHLMDEGLSEQEALEKMLVLTAEERTEIIEGSCGSKKKSKKKGY